MPFILKKRYTSAERATACPLQSRQRERLKASGQLVDGALQASGQLAVIERCSSNPVSDYTNKSNK
jgi:hypothetical protein